MRRSPSLLARLTGAVAGAVLVAAAALSVAAPAQAASLTQVTGFGSNPGNLAMYAYRPDNLPANAPAVVLLHGCTQNAAGYFANSGWQKYADQWKFALIVPEQKSANNANTCFNWFETGDTARGQGEALSIKQMVDHARSSYGTAADRVYVSGLSAGGAMSAVMLAAYPDVFAAGSVIAGIPYRCATGMVNAFSCMSPGVDKTPAQWGDLVRNAYAGYSGPRPRVAVWHGTSDYTVVVANATESRDQWTNVLGVSQTPTSTAQLPGGTSLEVYGNEAVRVYRVSGMGHGTRSTPAPAPISAAAPPRTSWTPSAPPTGTRSSSAWTAAAPTRPPAPRSARPAARALRPPASPPATTRTSPPAAPTTPAATPTPTAPTSGWASTTPSTRPPSSRPPPTTG